MLITFIEKCRANGQGYARGDTADLADAEATALIRMGRALPATPAEVPAKPKRKAKTED